MSIGPFIPSAARIRSDSRRAYLAILAACVGIAAALLAYAFSPGIRHVVGRAAHSVGHTVTNIFDHDQPRHAGRRHRHGSQAQAKPVKPMQPMQQSKPVKPALKAAPAGAAGGRRGQTAAANHNKPE